jgi:hypothetical protein
LKYPWPFGKIKREGVKPSSLNNNPMKMQNICSFSAFKQPIELIIIGKQKQKMTTKSNVFFLTLQRSYLMTNHGPPSLSPCLLWFFPLNCENS